MKSSMPYRNPTPELKGSSGSGTYDIGEDFHNFLELTQQYEKKGYNKAKDEDKKLLEAKDREIAQLKKQLDERNATPPPEQRFCYNRALFNRDNGDVVITALIYLTDRKCSKNKFVIDVKTDWYIVWKVLKYHSLFIGNCYDFLEIINDCVLPKIDKNKRDISKITPNSYNFNSFKNGNPIKDIDVYHWPQKLYEEIQKRTDDPKLRGTSGLERAVMIRRELETLLKHQGITSPNYE